MAMQRLLLLCALSGAASFSKSFCPSKLHAVYADMHDGDKKEITIDGNSMSIKPSGNNQTWVINAAIDTESCSAMVNFNVPGKPGPPPVPLQASLWWSISSSGYKSEFEFTDPSGTIAEKTAPLNRWVELKKPQHPEKAWCFKYLNNIYADMHDGDKKQITVDGASLVIRPSGNKQTWVVESQLDYETCTATIDFNVPGKPGPPPVNLTASLVYSICSTGKKTLIEFTDPSGTLAAKDFPLNTWVAIGKAESELSIHV